MSSLFLCGGCSLNRTSYEKPNSTSSTSSSTETKKDESIESIYNLYKANGGTLDYDAWLKSIKGEDGCSLLTGKGVPANSNGKDGDSYIDISTWDFYSKSNGRWSKIGNIQGADGKDGTIGKDGANGKDGKDATEYVPAIFKDEDGNILYEKYYAKGTNIVYDGPAPTKTVVATDGTYYSVPFLGWDNSLNNIQKPTVFTAKFLLSDLRMLRKSFLDCDYYRTMSLTSGGTENVFYYQNYWFDYNPTATTSRGYILCSDKLYEFTITHEVKDKTTLVTPASISVNTNLLYHDGSTSWTHDDLYKALSYLSTTKTFSLPVENELIYTFKSNTYSQGFYYTSDSQKVSDDLAKSFWGKTVPEYLAQTGDTFDSYWTEITMSSKNKTINGFNETVTDKVRLLLGKTTDDKGYYFDYVFDGHGDNPYHEMIENAIKERL